MNKEQKNKLTNAKDVGELMELSHEFGQNLTKEDATRIFNKLKNHKLDDENLSTVSGGYWINCADEQKYFVGDVVDAYVDTHDLKGFDKRRCVVVGASIEGIIFGTWEYSLRVENDGSIDKVCDTDIVKKY